MTAAHQLLRDRSPVLYCTLPHTWVAELTAHVMWYTHTMRSAPPHTTAGRPPRAKRAANWATCVCVCVCACVREVTNQVSQQHVSSHVPISICLPGIAWSAHCSKPAACFLHYTNCVS